MFMRNNDIISMAVDRCTSLPGVRTVVTRKDWSGIVVRLLCAASGPGAARARAVGAAPCSPGGLGTRSPAIGTLSTHTFV